MWPSTSLTLLRELVDPAKRDSAWTAFVTRYDQPIRVCCVRHGVLAHDLDAAVNGVLIHLLTKIDRYEQREGSGFRKWLSTVIRNHVASEQRSNRRFQSFGPIPDGDSLADKPRSKADQFADDLADALGHIFDDDQKEAMKRVRSQVSERDWDIAMSVLSGESAKTVGERHGLDPLNTGKIANAVKRKIEEELKKLNGL